MKSLKWVVLALALIGVLSACEQREFTPFNVEKEKLQEIVDRFETEIASSDGCDLWEWNHHDGNHDISTGGYGYSSSEYYEFGSDALRSDVMWQTKAPNQIVCQEVITYLFARESESQKTYEEFDSRFSLIKVGSDWDYSTSQTTHCDDLQTCDTVLMIRIDQSYLHDHLNLNVYIKTLATGYNEKGVPNSKLLAFEIVNSYVWRMAEALKEYNTPR